MPHIHFNTYSIHSYANEIHCIILLLFDTLVSSSEATVTISKKYLYITVWHLYLMRYIGHTPYIYIFNKYTLVVYILSEIWSEKRKTSMTNRCHQNRGRIEAQLTSHIYVSITIKIEFTWRNKVTKNLIKMKGKYWKKSQYFSWNLIMHMQIDKIEIHKDIQVPNSDPWHY